MSTQLIPGDYEQRHNLPGPHEPVCPKRQPDPQYPYLFNPCGLALGHSGDCKPMDSIQAQRRTHQTIAEHYARVREIHKAHEDYTVGCQECEAERADAEFLAGVTADRG